MIGQSAETIHEKFPKVFQGLGFLKNPYHIEVYPTITPVVSPLRSTPDALRERLRSSLDDMEEKGVVEKVDGPTEWVNSTVIIEKPNSDKLRICLDPRPIKESYQGRTLQDANNRGNHEACGRRQSILQAGRKSWLLANTTR